MNIPSTEYMLTPAAQAAWQDTCAVGDQVWWADADDYGPGVIAELDHDPQDDHTLVRLLAWDHEAGAPAEVHVNLVGLHPIAAHHGVDAETQTHLDDMQATIRAAASTN
ncbi:hypothetical protein [Sphaerisporangium aureirubrum]|uniref:Uncharacterized protein n=1 Tax=Sphaerisporangium aureirubrum TaxID=1544736 RepID=A0ABW1NCG7_9ACTN